MLQNLGYIKKKEKLLGIQRTIVYHSPVAPSVKTSLKAICSAIFCVVNLYFFYFGHMVRSLEYLIMVQPLPSPGHSCQVRFTSLPTMFNSVSG